MARRGVGGRIGGRSGHRGATSHPRIRGPHAVYYYLARMVLLAIILLIVFGGVFFSVVVFIVVVVLSLVLILIIALAYMRKREFDVRKGSGHPPPSSRYPPQAKAIGTGEGRGHLPPVQGQGTPMRTEGGPISGQQASTYPRGGRCPECGSTVTRGERFCRNCGTNLD